MPRRARLKLPADVDTVVTDGERAAVIVGIDDAGRYILEDLHTDMQRDKDGRLQVVEKRFEITASALLQHWRVVRKPELLEDQVAA